MIFGIFKYTQGAYFKLIRDFYTIIKGTSCGGDTNFFFPLIAFFTDDYF